MALRVVRRRNPFPFLEHLTLKEVSDFEWLETVQRNGILPKQHRPYYEQLRERRLTYAKNWRVRETE